MSQATLQRASTLCKFHSRFFYATTFIFCTRTVANQRLELCSPWMCQVCAAGCHTPGDAPACARLRAARRPSYLPTDYSACSYALFSAARMSVCCSRCGRFWSSRPVDALGGRFRARAPNGAAQSGDWKARCDEREPLFPPPTVAVPPAAGSDSLGRGISSDELDKQCDQLWLISTRWICGCKPCLDHPALQVHRYDCGQGWRTAVAGRILRGRRSADGHCLLDPRQ